MSHVPCCIRPYHCMDCDMRRANREINRLREVLRTTMDTLLDKSEEAKDMRFQRDAYKMGIDSLWETLALVQRGKLSASELWLPDQYTGLNFDARRGSE